MPSADITKRAIADAMKTLMAQKPLAKISVGDIVEVCSINRNSFYYHFKDKFDLVNWIFYTEITKDLNENNILTGSPQKLIEYVCTYFYENKAFYQNALSVSGQNSFAEYFVDNLKGLVKTRAGDMFEDDENQDFFAGFFADAFVVAVYRWLTDGAKIPPDKLAALMIKAAAGAGARLSESFSDADNTPL